MRNVVLNLLVMLVLVSCKMTLVPEPTKTIPTISTISMTLITDTCAVSGGKVANDGGEPITSRGICWATNPSPTTNDQQVIDSTGSIDFICKLTHLSGNTVYYVRAFAINNQGVSYGNEITFTTPNSLFQPKLSTSSATDITYQSAISGGTILADGGTPISSKGICWSTNENPTIADSKLDVSTQDTSFKANMTGLVSETTYYVRAYARNVKGLSYGTQISFKTPSQPNTVRDIDGNLYPTITIGTQTWMMENLRVTKYRNGEPIPYVKDDRTWLKSKTGAQCTYNNTTDPSFIATNGRLYNWYAAVDPRGIAPVGWHVPTKAEWETFNEFVKLNLQTSTDVASFNSQTYGYRNGFDTAYYVYKNLSIFWWSVTEEDSAYAWSNDGDKGSFNFGMLSIVKNFGVSVRCIKDN